jgi:transposase InsO family protein
VQDWIGAIGARTAYITPGSPWENGFIESFNARLARRASRRRDLRIVDALNEMLRQSLSIALKDNEHQRPPSHRRYPNDPKAGYPDGSSGMVLVAGNGARCTSLAGAVRVGGRP